ncbi:MAG: TetR/AcrR family transcriptional regulator [Pseudomonadota bacterium]
MNARQKQIANAAIDLFLKDGVGVSTASIAHAAGVSNGTLFYAYPTKQTLIDAIYISTKEQLVAALTLDDSDQFNRATLQRLWSEYMAWGRQRPQDRQIMNLLWLAGLASSEAKTQGDEILARFNVLFEQAFADGVIRGPNVAYLNQLVVLQLDLVLTQNLRGDDEALAFDILCNSIGLTQ